MDKLLKDLSCKHAALKELLAQKFAEPRKIMDEKEKVCVHACVCINGRNKGSVVVDSNDFGLVEWSIHEDMQ